MSEQAKSSLSSHRRVWLFSAVIFFLLALAAAGPLVFKAFADASSAHEQVIQARNAAISEAIMDNDYNAWDSLVQDETLKQQIDSNNFESFAEAYRLLEKGMLTEAELLKRQIGIKEEIKQNAKVSNMISQAIVDKDYSLWRQAVGNDYAQGVVTSGNFDRYASFLQDIEKGRLNRAVRYQYETGIKQKMDYSSSRE